MSYFIYVCVYVCVCVCPCVCVCAHSVVFNFLQPYGSQPIRLLCPCDSPSKNTGAGCHALLQGIFPTQGLNPHLLHLSCIGRWVLYHQHHLGNPYFYVCAQLLSHFQLFVTAWTVACWPPLSMGFSRQEYRNGLPCPPPRNLPNPGIKPRSPILWADSLPFETPEEVQEYWSGQPIPSPGDLPRDP